MSQPEVNPGLLSLLPSFSTLQAPLSAAGEAPETDFSGVLSDLLPLQTEAEDNPVTGDHLPPVGQLLPPQATGVQDYQPRLLLDRIRQSQKISIENLTPQPGVQQLPGEDLGTTGQTVLTAEALVQQANRAATSVQPLAAELKPVAGPQVSTNPAVTSNKAIMPGQTQPLPEAEFSDADAEQLALPDSDVEPQAAVVKAASVTTAPLNKNSVASSAEAPLLQSTPQVSEVQIATRSEGFAASDQAIITDAEEQQLEEHLQLSDSKERLEFGRDKQQWAPAMGSRIAVMVAENIHQAEIHLDPPELGSMEIKLQVNQEQTSIQVQAQNPQVRDVLEANAQRLRDALAEQGLELTGFDVSSQSQSEQQNNDQQQGGENTADSEWLAEGVQSESGTTATNVVSHNGLFDAYA